MELCYDGALVMPSRYAVMDEKEMMYVEGGYTVTRNITGIYLRLTGKETSQFLSDASWAAVSICAATGLAGAAAAAVVGGIIGVYGFTISRMNSNNSGVTFYWDWQNLISVNPIPKIKDNY